MNSLLFFATTEATEEKGDILASLGIDVRLLVIQAIAFLVLLWVLTKFVYPVLSGMLEKREATIREGIEAAENAEKKATKANAEVEELLSTARKQAKAVIASAKDEAAAIAEAASDNAARQTERMLKKAEDEIEKEIDSARKALRDETIGLVALATEKVVGSAMTEKIDQKVVASALKDAQ
jgi:F-type H+-transporting ATPase subunit b